MQNAKLLQNLMPMQNLEPTQNWVPTQNLTSAEPHANVELQTDAEPQANVESQATVEPHSNMEPSTNVEAIVPPSITFTDPEGLMTILPAMEATGSQMPPGQALMSPVAAPLQIPVSLSSSTNSGLLLPLLQSPSLIPDISNKEHNQATMATNAMENSHPINNMQVSPSSPKNKKAKKSVKMKPTNTMTARYVL
jgi:hypothetical protein